MHLSKWLGVRGSLLFALLIALHLVPIWGFTYFPSQDGPAHLDNANILREYHRPDRAIFQQYFSLNRNLEPNWCGHLLLAGLMTLLPVLISEKVLLSGYVILLPVSVRYALRANGEGSDFLAVLAFPFVYNYLLHMGLYNFSYSLVLFFFVVGYWARYQDRFALRQVVVLTLLMLLLYFCHIFSLLMAWVTLGLLAAWLTGIDLLALRRRTLESSATWAAIRSRAFVTPCACLPALLLVAGFVLQQGTSESPPQTTGRLLKSLVRLDSLVSFSDQEAWFSIPLVLLFVGLTLHLLIVKWRQRRLCRWDGWLLVYLGWLFIYFVAPSGLAGGELISDRINLYLCLALILWFGAQPPEWLPRVGIQLGGAAIALGMVAFHMVQYRQLNDYLEEYTSGMALIEPNRTLLPLCFSTGAHFFGESVHGSAALKPFRHASGYIAAQREVVDLYNYEAFTSYFPLTFRKALNPLKSIPLTEQLAGQPCVDLLTYPRTTRGRIDYVLLWSLGNRQRDEPCTTSMLAQLGREYELIHTSPKRGLMQMYRRREWPSS